MAVSEVRHGAGEVGTLALEVAEGPSQRGLALARGVKLRLSARLRRVWAGQARGESHPSVSSSLRSAVVGP